MKRRKGVQPLGTQAKNQGMLSIAWVIQDYVTLFLFAIEQTFSMQQDNLNVSEIMCAWERNYEKPHQPSKKKKKSILVNHSARGSLHRLPIHIFPNLTTCWTKLSVLLSLLIYLGA